MSLKIFIVCVSGFVILFTLETVWLLVLFLSYYPLSTQNEWSCSGILAYESFSGSIDKESVISHLARNELLLVLFIFQHSFMAHINIHSILENMGIEVLTRSLYVLTSCACLQGLMHIWQPIDSICLWDAHSNHFIGKSVWCSMVLVHFISWFMVFGGCLLVDVGELTGMKQVINYVRGTQNPLTSKSEGLHRYCKHMHHPSFVGFCMMLWAVPKMSLDRALLAVQLTIYMFSAWQTDERDICFLYSQLEETSEFDACGDWHHIIENNIEMDSQNA